MLICTSSIFDCLKDLFKGDITISCAPITCILSGSSSIIEVDGPVGVALIILFILVVVIFFFLSGFRLFYFVLFFVLFISMILFFFRILTLVIRVLILFLYLMLLMFNQIHKNLHGFLLHDIYFTVFP